MHGIIVGHSELENVDPDLGRAWGDFRPGVGYDLVQPVFRLYAQAVSRDGTNRDSAALERYYKARDALKLDLQDQHGRAIRTSVIHIVDYTVEAGSSALQLDVLIKDDSYWSSRVTG